MSQPIGQTDYCDPSPSAAVTLRVILDAVGTRPSFGRVGVLVTVMNMHGPRWNTPDGARPTQAQVNAGLNPKIYHPIDLHIDRIYKGEATPSQLTAAAVGGALGRDVMNSCAFSSPYRPIIGETKQLLEVGKRYVMILGNEITTGRATGPLVLPGIDDLYPVEGDKVLMWDGALQPLPQ